MITIKNSPQTTLARIAIEISKKTIRGTKVSEKTNFDEKVKSVASHISLVACSPSASSEIWIPMASENASAIANTTMPANTASLECVPECSPTMMPKVVITPEVSPNPTPLSKVSFIVALQPLTFQSSLTS